MRTWVAQGGRMAHVGRHAIVIGASMGGLLAGHVFADYYDEVTLIDRDALPLAYEPRKGVPQGRHTHGLLARGRAVLEELFPGFTAEMVADGAVSGDVADAVLWFNHGFYLRSVPSTPEQSAYLQHAYIKKRLGRCRPRLWGPMQTPFPSRFLH